MADALVFYSVALITVVSGAWGLALAYRARRRSEPLPFSPADLVAIALSVVVALALSFVVPQSAEAHYIGSKCADTSEFNKQVNNVERCRHVAKVIHRFWKNDDAAHYAQEVFSCESGLDKFSRIRDRSTQHRMIPSLSRAWRVAYHFRDPDYRNRLTWRVEDQMRVAHDIYRSGGWQPWGAGESWGCA